MINGSATHGALAPMRRPPGRLPHFLLLAPALLVGVGLFGGGLFMGLLQSLGRLPAAGLTHLTLAHFGALFGAPDFLISLRLTFYVAATATLIATVISVALALFLVHVSQSSRLMTFLLQIPLTVPHLVVAVAMIFLLTPTGLAARLAAFLGLIDGVQAFPLLVNDTWCFGMISAYVWKEVPFITLMILSVLGTGGVELLDVGRTLKAGPWQRFRFITLPTIFPSLSAAALIVFAYTFGAFEVPFLMGRTYPMLLPVWAYKSYSDVDLMARPEGIATGLVIAAVVSLTIFLAHAILSFCRRRGMVL
jgi:putative spermidine/putrescine transport system permease protein